MKSEVEVTPKNIRIRKKHLTSNERKKQKMRITSSQKNSS